MTPEVDSFNWLKLIDLFNKNFVKLISGVILKIFLIDLKYIKIKFWSIKQIKC